MTRPMPALYAPTAALRRKVIDAIYAQGWRLGELTRKQVDEGARGTPEDPIKNPYVGLFGGRFGVISLSYPRGHLTLVNSPAHLVAYCKTLGAASPKVQPST